MTGGPLLLSPRRKAGSSKARTIKNRAIAKGKLRRRLRKKGSRDRRWGLGSRASTYNGGWESGDGIEAGSRNELHKIQLHPSYNCGERNGKAAGIPTGKAGKKEARKYS